MNQSDLKKHSNFILEREIVHRFDTRMTISQKNTSEPVVSAQKAVSEIGPLTSMRGLAAVLVMFFHLRYAFVSVAPFNYKIFEIPFLSKGYLWVDFFFILSGFIMAYRYASEFKMNLKFFKDFIFMRWLRIYPLHFLTLFAFLAKSLFENGWNEIAAFKTTIFMNLFLVQSWGYYLGKTWNYPSWSLSEEWGAYLFFPILLCGFHQFRFSKWIQLVLVLSCLAGLASFVHFFHPGNINMTEDFGLVRCVFEFSIGIGLFYLRNLLKDKVSTKAWDFLSGLTMILSFVCLQYEMPDILSVGLSAFLVFFLSLANGRFSNILNLRIFKFLGQISFSIYIWHAFFGKVFESLYVYFGTPSMSLALGAALYFGLGLFIIAFSRFSYDLIEVRLAKLLKSKLSMKKIAGLSSNNSSSQKVQTVYESKIKKSDKYGFSGT